MEETAPITFIRWIFLFIAGIWAICFAWLIRQPVSISITKVYIPYFTSWTGAVCFGLGIFFYPIELTVIAFALFTIGSTLPMMMIPYWLIADPASVLESERTDQTGEEK